MILRLFSNTFSGVGLYIDLLIFYLYIEWYIGKVSEFLIFPIIMNHVSSYIFFVVSSIFDICRKTPPCQPNVYSCKCYVYGNCVITGKILKWDLEII